MEAFKASSNSYSAGVTEVQVQATTAQTSLHSCVPGSPSLPQADAAEVSADTAATPAAGSPYLPLSRHRREIRLLTILLNDTPFNGVRSDALRCRLETVTLIDGLEYECLSYCWGDAQPYTTISLNGHVIGITRNAYDALCRFHDDHHNGVSQIQYLWVDALCINQDDLEERAHQVSFMAEIYRGASCVRAWLAQPQEPSLDYLASMEDGFRILGGIEALGTKGQWSENIQYSHAVRSLVEIFRNPYWSRRWIVQEIAFARVLTMYHNGLPAYSFSVEALQDLCLAAVENRSSSTDCPEHPHPVHNATADYTEDFPIVFGVIGMISTAQSMAQRNGRLDTLVSLCGQACSRPQDHVYSLLGFLPAAWDVVPDYNKPWEELFIELTLKVIENTSDLRPLRFAAFNHPTLPSWSLDLSTKPWRNVVQNVSLFKAAGDSKFKLETDHLTYIRLPALVIDTVTAVLIPNEEHLSSLSYRLRKWTQLYQEHGGATAVSSTQDQGLPPQIPRTMLSDELFGLGKSSRLSPKQLEMVVDGLSQCMDSDDHSDEIMSFLPPFDKARLMRKKSMFFMTTMCRPGKTGSLTQVGDKVCVFASCSIPFCIRPVMQDGELVYRLVGECYVDGIMDGEDVSEALAIHRETKLNAIDDDVFEDLTII